MMLVLLMLLEFWNETLCMVTSGTRLGVFHRFITDGEILVAGLLCKREKFDKCVLCDTVTPRYSMGIV